MWFNFPFMPSVFLAKALNCTSWKCRNCQIQFVIPHIWRGDVLKSPWIICNLLKVFIWPIWCISDVHVHVVHPDSQCSLNNFFILHPLISSQLTLYRSTSHQTHTHTLTCICACTAHTYACIHTYTFLRLVGSLDCSDWLRLTALVQWCASCAFPHRCECHHLVCHVDIIISP